MFNRPKQPSHSHAGFLMALGLLGHLEVLAPPDVYRYLTQEHDATTVGVLLGMAAARRGTMDATVSKMLFLHIPTRCLCVRLGLTQAAQTLPLYMNLANVPMCRASCRRLWLRGISIVCIGAPIG